MVKPKCITQSRSWTIAQKAVASICKKISRHSPWMNNRHCWIYWWIAPCIYQGSKKRLSRKHISTIAHKTFKPAPTWQRTSTWNCCVLRWKWDMNKLKLTELLAPSTKNYSTTEGAIRWRRIDTLHITKSSGTCNFPSEYDVVKPFIDYLSDTRYYVMMKWCTIITNNKKVQKGNYDTSKRK